MKKTSSLKRVLLALSLLVLAAFIAVYQIWGKSNEENLVSQPPMVEETSKPIKAKRLKVPEKAPEQEAVVSDKVMARLKAAGIAGGFVRVEAKEDNQ